MITFFEMSLYYVNFAGYFLVDVMHVMFECMFFLLLFRHLVFFVLVFCNFVMRLSSLVISF